MSSKINIGRIVSDHWSTLHNHNTKRVSLGDIALFLAIPTAIAWLLHYRGVSLNDGLTNVLTTAFSIFAALLFNLLLLVYDLLKKEEVSASPSKLRHDLLDEVSKNVSFSILIALFVIILLILNAVKLGIHWVDGTLAVMAFWLGSVFLLTLFMVLKRIHNLLVTTFDKVG